MWSVMTQPLSLHLKGTMEKIVSLEQLDIANGLYTYADYLTWKFGETVELIKGKVWKMAAPSRYHQTISFRLSGLFYIHFKKQSCDVFAAPFDIRLADKRKSAIANKQILTVVQPDLCVVCDKSKLDEKGCLGAPDLVVEILSRGNSAKEMKVKKALYEENQIREYWVFDPEHGLVFQYHLTDENVYGPLRLLTQDDTLQSAIFPELQIQLDEVFQFED